MNVTLKDFSSLHDLRHLFVKTKRCSKNEPLVLHYSKNDFKKGYHSTKYPRLIDFKKCKYQNYFDRIAYCNSQTSSYIVLKDKHNKLNYVIDSNIKFVILTKDIENNNNLYIIPKGTIGVLTQEVDYYGESFDEFFNFKEYAFSINSSDYRTVSARDYERIFNC